MKFEILDKSIDEISSDYELIFVVNKNLKHKFIKDGDIFDFYDFKGDGVLNLTEKRRIYVGIQKIDYENLRIAVAKAYSNLKDLKVTSLKLASYIAKCQKKSYQSVVEGFLLGSYKFDKYKSEKKVLNLEQIFISTDEFEDKNIDLEAAYTGLNHGKIIANATNFAKDIVNEIPEIYNALRFEEDALKLSKTNPKIECIIYDEDFLKSQNMNAFLAVNKASPIPPRLIHLSYKPKKSLKKIVFVGKGLTYDSGGLSLKPADYMLTMKADKSGAAAVMAIIKAASELDLPFEIHSVIGATENMIGGNAYKPDDVLISRSGVTIEVRNTDAEGRLVLADCLSWAQEFNPDILIDMATLTGACVVGLGEYTSGIMGNNEELKEAFCKFSKDSGDFNTILHFNDHLRELIKSQIADVSNTASSRYGGAITAGLFLDKFIKDEFKDKWIHQDIAGPAYVEKAWGYNASGATGAGVRMNLYYLLKLARELKAN